jgi:hypothetical protein
MAWNEKENIVRTSASKRLIGPGRTALFSLKVIVTLPGAKMIDYESYGDDVNRRRHRTLDMMWPESDVWCLCCQEPLLITPEGNYLACRWSGDVCQIKGWGKIYQIGGKKALPCSSCQVRKPSEIRQIEGCVTRYVVFCSCGFSDRGERETEAIDFLPTDYTIEWLDPTNEVMEKMAQFRQIKEAVKEALKELDKSFI